MRSPTTRLFPLAALLLTSCASGDPRPGAGAPGVAAPAEAPAFVSSPRLQESLGGGDLVLIDARPLREFLASHLPGAVSVAPDNLRGTAGGVPATLYPARVLATAFARAGVSRASNVVVYGAESDVDATFVATAARVAGARRVSVLDGGFSRWTGEGRPTTKERRLAAAAKADLRGDGTLLVTVDEARARVGDGRTVFLDVRSEEQWAAGRIPGARNRPWKKDLDGGALRPASAIRADLEAAGVSWEKPVVVYCNSGHQASEGFYVLKYVLGHPDVRLYQGSWMEWSMTPGTPRETSAPAGPK